MKTSRISLALLTAGILVLTSCSGSDNGIGLLPKDMRLPVYQANLLELAFKTATAIPVEPHIKDRSRAQEDVVDACLKLGQPRRALIYIEKIDNWRKGAAYADLAFYCASRGHVRGMERFLILAEKTIGKVDQDWRKDRVRAKIASTYFLLGHPEEAEKFESNLEDSEKSKVLAARSMKAVDKAGFDEQMKSLDKAVLTGIYDVIHNALFSAVELFNSCYGQPAFRQQVEDKIKASWKQLPVTVRLDLLSEMARVCLAHNDKAEALAQVNEAQQLYADSTWPADYAITERAQLAALRFQVGDEKKARAEINAAAGQYEPGKKNIVDIYRAGILRSLAESYLAMGDTRAASEYYKKAVDAGVENPNSRPRAEDLTATCVSIALHAYQPDPRLWQRLGQVNAALREPW